MPKQKSTEKKHGVPGFRSCKAVLVRESWKIPLSKIETGATARNQHAQRMHMKQLPSEQPKNDF